MMKQTLTALIAATIFIPIAGYLTANQLQADPLTLGLEAAIAQGPGGGGPGLGGGGPRWIEALDLSEDQITQIQAIRAAARDEMQPLRDDLRAARAAMHDLMASDATAETLRTQHEEVQALQQALGDARFEVMLETREVLTPEQRRELAQLLEERRDNRGPGRGLRGGPGRGMTPARP